MTEVDLDQEGTGAFMVTLCWLSKPVSIQQPRSPRLASFRFFTSSSRQPDGSERLYLHMGYFRTLSDAQHWLGRIRARYPHAIATAVPPALLQRPDSDVSAPPTAVTRTAPAVQDLPPVTEGPLSDTQVMRILEGRPAGDADSGADERIGTRVELLRPDDTETRRTLKEAVAAGVPVPFAVQLEWSLQPIDADRVPLLDIFEGYTLYRTEKRRADRSCYFLRLGFFTDPLSAKELACQVRSTFASAAVVPVTEEEFLHAGEARIDIPDPAGPLHQRTSRLPGSHRSAAQDPQTAASTMRVESTERYQPGSGGSASPGQETLEQTLEVLAQRETWTQPDALSDTGVRHLKVTLDERTGRPSPRQKLPARFA